MNNSSSSRNGADGPAEPSANQYSLNSRMMVGALMVLFLVVFFILMLHVYAKWFWRRGPSGRRRSAAWRRHRSGLDLAGGGALIAAAGLHQSVLDALPVFTYKLPPSADEPLLECAVCLCEFEQDEQGRLLPSCAHSFHTDCIDMWFHSHDTCPLCRTVVSIATAHEHSSSAPPSPSLLPHETSSSSSASIIDPALPPPLPYPNNVLFWGDHNHAISQLSSPGIATGGSSSTRSLPQISIDISRRTESFATSRCLSLSLSRCPSVDMDEASSQAPVKSPINRMSIRRLLSWDRGRGRMRLSPSGRLDVGHLQSDDLQAV